MSAAISMAHNIRPRMSIDQSAASRPKQRITAVLRCNIGVIAFEKENPSRP